MLFMKDFVVVILDTNSDVLAHEYGEVINEKIWRVATIHVPALMGVVEPLVPTPPRADGP